MMLIAAEEAISFGMVYSVVLPKELFAPSIC
jgi:hypothetical protein